MVPLKHERASTDVRIANTNFPSITRRTSQPLKWHRHAKEFRAMPLEDTVKGVAALPMAIQRVCGKGQCEDLQLFSFHPWRVICLFPFMLQRFRDIEVVDSSNTLYLWRQLLPHAWSCQHRFWHLEQGQQRDEFLPLMRPSEVCSFRCWE